MHSRRPSSRILHSLTLIMGVLLSHAITADAAADEPLTDVKVAKFLAELEDALGSQDTDRVMAFVDEHYADDVRISFSLSAAAPGQSEPVVQQATLTKAEQIAQYRQAEALYAMTTEHAYKLTVREISVAPDGESARAEFEGLESAILNAPTGEGTTVQIRHKTQSRCSMMMESDDAGLAVTQVDCSYVTVAENP